MTTRVAKGGVLVLGGGFAGAYVARLLGKRGATIVSPENFMLYTPILPEAASGTLEPRHVVVPLRQMCPHAELLLGRATGLHDGTVAVETEAGGFEISYDQLVVAVGGVARSLPIPGLAEHALAFKDLADAIHLRNHVPRELEGAAAEVDAGRRRPHLSFVFVGAGYAGVESLAELHDLVEDALRYYPALKTEPQRWVLVDAAPKILPEIPSRLGDYAARLLAKRGIEIRTGTTVERLEEDAVVLTGGERIDTHTLVWTAGIRPRGELSQWGLPLDEQGRIKVDGTLRVEGRENVLGPRRQRRRAQPGHARPVRPANLPARASAGAPTGEEPPGRRAAVPLPHAGPGGDARTLQGHRRRARGAAARLPRLVRHPHVPPLTAAAANAEAARRRRLDDRALLPARHRRARHARPSAAARMTTSGRRE